MKINKYGTFTCKGYFTDLKGRKKVYIPFICHTFDLYMNEILTTV